MHLEWKPCANCLRNNLQPTITATRNQLTFGSFYLTRDGSGPNCEISRDVAVPVCEAFVEADKV